MIDPTSFHFIYTIISLLNHACCFSPSRFTGPPLSPHFPRASITLTCHTRNILPHPPPLSLSLPPSQKIPTPTCAPLPFAADLIHSSRCSIGYRIPSPSRHVTVILSLASVSLMLWYAVVGTGLEVVYIHTYIHIRRFLRGVRV